MKAGKYTTLKDKDDDLINVEMETQSEKINKEENDDILITAESYDRLEDLKLDEITTIINSFEPVQIKDWPRRPYKAILIVFLLLFSGVLFTTVGLHNYMNNKTYDHYLPYLMLGSILLIPGVYYTVVLIFIWMGKEEYDYDMIPDISDNH